MNSETIVDRADEVISEFGGMRTRAPRMRDVFAVLGRLAKTTLTITLIGETGSGKNKLARAVHAASTRREGPLVVLDFGVPSTSLGDSRTFDIEQGVHTSRTFLPTAFEQAQGGTLLIDNASELSLELQARLLPILENQRAGRPGLHHDSPLDFRLIVVSNCELEAEVAAGRFRRDLYFRLAAAVVRVPPLRERLEDLPLLVDDLLSDIGQGHVRVAPEAITFLQSRQWFGNVRELRNTLETTLALLDTESIEFRTLERVGFGPESTPLDQLSLAGISLQQLETTAIKQTLQQVRGNKVRAAKVLGIAVSTLYEKLKRLSLD